MSGLQLQCSSCPARDHAACAMLDPDERRRIEAMGHKRSLTPGEELFAADPQANTAACATLISGLLKVVRCDADGVERIVALIHPGGFVGQLFAPQTGFAVLAASQSEVCQFPEAAYREMVATSPRLASGIARRALAAVDESRKLLDLVGRRRAEGKLAGLIAALADAAGSAPCVPAQAFELPLSREEIASILGITIETVSRRFTLLEQHGLIARDGPRRIEIRDPLGLAELAGLD